ncbi:MULTISPECIES: hypothetical protein [unclassified Robiginitalea]|mgnify:CR=1 FL=1|uniref:hypothetical protein n=1 Tax=Robiginitalea TaxID=252306 RepID=UPI00234953D2|nr:MULTISPECIES: hypothetical protein [unclassified Robiginitalea]MDC6353766.1 hypothetical protein [Robiginitalea sp. PM2]MDC6374033.1 hypothetical protein [Robiginitalea sp. SP8]
MGHFFRQLIILSALFTGLIATAQGTFEGTLENWPHGRAQIILPTDSPVVIGKVEADGKVSITLGEALAQRISASREADDGSGIRLVRSTVERAFYCRSDDVTSENGDLQLERATTRGGFYVGNLEEEELHGQIRLASSQAFGNSFFQLGKKDFVTGHYIEFYFAEADASVHGTCKTPTYTLDGKDVFDIIHEYTIDLKKGWNLVRVEVAETYTDQEGNVRPLKMVMKTVREVPVDTQFLFTAN